MAKAHDPGLQERLKELNAQVKDGKITKRQMFSTYDNLVTELLKDESLNTLYTNMAQLDTAKRLGGLGGPGISTSGKELQVVHYKCVHRHLVL